MRIESIDYTTIHTVTIRESSTDKVELTIDKDTGDITLYHAYREGMLSSTWHHTPLFVGRLKKDGVEYA